MAETAGVAQERDGTWEPTRTRAVERRPSRTRALARAMRPMQWLKNLLVVAAPGAAGVLFHPHVLGRTALAFTAMSLVASATYLVNDLLDVEADRRHPIKRSRPLASGHLSRRTAATAALALLALGTATATFLGGRFLAIAAVYVGVTLSYCVWLKRTEVFDIAAVASGYVLRALAGGIATGVPVSSWFLILTSSAALFVVAGKRAADAAVLRPEDGSPGARPRLDYPMPYLRYVWTLASGVAIAAYCLWAFDVPHLVDGVAWSEVSIVPFALAMLRYALIVERGGGGAPEEVVLHDRALQLVAVAWVAVYATGVYLR